MAGSAPSLLARRLSQRLARSAAAPGPLSSLVGSPGASCCTSSQRDMKGYLWAHYNEAKKVTDDLVPSIMSNLLNPDAIFSNNEMSLSDIEVYGFDYDYTLAFYSKDLHTLIFNTARDLLIDEHKYPEELRKYEYNPNFAIRGLHYDVHRALLMKIDAFHYIQLGTVYKGLNVVPDDQVIEMYEGSHVPLEQMSDFYGKSFEGNTMKQFMDIFSLPEMTLLSCANDYFLKNNLDYEPVHLYKDVKDSIRDVHVKGLMYKAILSDIERFICYGEQTRAVLAKLASHGKKMFLITNSPSSFVYSKDLTGAGLPFHRDKGMSFIVGKDWRDLFDVVIVQADKPNFFNDKRRPFRKVTERGVLLWDKIHKLDKGQIYKQGNLYEFLKLTGWRGSKVLYFGDHIYSDLAGYFKDLSGAGLPFYRSCCFSEDWRDDQISTEGQQSNTAEDFWIINRKSGNPEGQRDNLELVLSFPDLHVGSNFVPFPQLKLYCTQDLTLKHGWRTGAIIPELRSEIKIMNTEQYIEKMTWLQGLTGLLERMQNVMWNKSAVFTELVYRDAESQMVLTDWITERKQMREVTKKIFNNQFGSIFRTHHNPTYFLRRLSRFADLYMASLSCLLNYDLHHTFYPRRTPLQHEVPVWSDQLCTGTFRIPFLREMAATK